MLSNTLFSLLTKYCGCVGYIDLSKRRVSPEDITKCEERYMKSKTVASILRYVASKLPDDVGTTTAADPSSPTSEEQKKSRRAKKEAQEDELAVVDEGPGAGGES